MTLNDFLMVYGDVRYEGDPETDYFHGNHFISIKGYCEETCQQFVMTANWYNTIKNKAIKRWQTIGGGIYPVEICIELER